MKGRLYGVGVGPGEPEQMTLKALRIIKEADVIAVPGKSPRESLAWKIAEGALKLTETGSAVLDEKEVLAIPMPMTKEKSELERAHKEGMGLLQARLDQGKDIAFLTLGDPTIYSTYIYLHKRIREKDYETEIVSGVPSFCAAAATVGIGLTEQEEMLHLIPASYGVEEAMDFPGTRVLMKAGRQIDEVKKALSGREDQVIMVENCGMEGQQIYYGAEEIPENASYYSLIIVKK